MWEFGLSFSYRHVVFAEVHIHMCITQPLLLYVVAGTPSPTASQDGASALMMCQDVNEAAATGIQ